jgi:hypothetical protein
LATANPSRRANRTPALADVATAIQVSARRNSGVNGACGSVKPGTCSANVTAVHSQFAHLNRRTVKAVTVVTPPSAASATRRTYRPCTRRAI